MARNTTAPADLVEAAMRQANAFLKGEGDGTYDEALDALQDLMHALAHIDTTLSNTPTSEGEGLAAELERLIAEATPGDLTSAKASESGGFVECPMCSGQGEVEQDRHYNNFDGVALGVQFYGIGKHFGAHEALWRFFTENRNRILTALNRMDADRKAVLDALDWFGMQQNLELDYHGKVYGDDDEPDLWRVSQVNGGVNDREWSTVAHGETPADAIVAAFRALSEKETAR